MVESGISLNHQELNIIFNMLGGVNKKIPYLKWITEIRGQLSPRREKLCNDLFEI